MSDKPPKKPRKRATPVPKEPKVWDPEKAKRCTLYPRSPEEFAYRQEQMRQHVKDMVAAGKWGRPKGLPDGWAKPHRRRELARVRDEAATLAEFIVYQMKQNDIVTIDDHRAELCLQALVEIVIAKKTDETAGTETYAYADQNRIQAAKAVMDFTKKKPASKQELEVRAAEDFLRELAKDG